MILGIDGPHEQVADEAERQQPREDVHGDVVDLRARHAGVELELADVVHEHRAEDAGGRPGGEQAAVDGADHLRAEHVREIRRHRREAAAVHRQDDAEERDEQREAADAGATREWRRRARAEQEEDRVGQPCARASDSEAQKMRPAMLNSDSRPVKPAAIAGDRAASCVLLELA